MLTQASIIERNDFHECVLAISKTEKGIHKSICNDKRDLDLHKIEVYRFPIIDSFRPSTLGYFVIVRRNTEADFRVLISSRKSNMRTVSRHR